MGNNFVAGYNYSRSFHKPVNMNTPVTLPSNNIAFRTGMVAGATVNLLGTAATKFLAGSRVALRWFKSNVMSPLKTMIRGTPYMLTKLVDKAQVVGIKAKNLAIKVGKGAVKVGKGAAKVGREFINIGRDAADRFKKVAKLTKRKYRQKKADFKSKHAYDPSFGTKARYAYDAFVEARVERNRDTKYEKAHSKTVNTIRDFKKASGDKLGSLIANGMMRLKDAAILGAGIYGLSQLSDSKEDKEEEVE